MAIVSIHNKPKRIGNHKKTFGELKVGDTYYAYSKSYDYIDERTVLKTENNKLEFRCFVEIGGPIVRFGYINLYYGIRSGQRNIVYPDSSITINEDLSLIYATTKDELDEAIKYYS